MAAPHGDAPRSSAARKVAPKYPSQAARAGQSSKAGGKIHRAEPKRQSGKGRPEPSGQGRPAVASRSGRPSTPTDAPPRRTSAPPARGAAAPARATEGRSGRPAPAAQAGAHGQSPRRARDGGTAPERPRRPRAPQLTIPPEADPQLLDPAVRRELRTLAQPDVVAGHLVAAGLLLEEDPARAYAHAQAAKALAGRSGAVREAVGVAAYAAGDYAAALAELRAARRITGSAEHLPLLADCERGLGRPDRALAVVAEPDASRLDRAGKVELAIVASGARRDLGQPDAAVLALHGAELDSDEVHDWTPRLWYAYADALLAAGRTAEARQWFAATVTVDDDDTTDAVERLDGIPEPD